LDDLLLGDQVRDLVLPKGAKDGGTGLQVWVSEFLPEGLCSFAVGCNEDHVGVVLLDIDF
jgi:hypothetical protein